MSGFLSNVRAALARRGSDAALIRKLRTEGAELDAAVIALSDVAGHLLRGDRPESLDRAHLDAWVDGLTEDEAAAVNACLGTNYGTRPGLAWDASHPVARGITRAEEIRFEADVLAERGEAKP